MASCNGTTQAGNRCPKRKMSELQHAETPVRLSKGVSQWVSLKELEIVNDREDLLK
jgi:hypothetical protein